MYSLVNSLNKFEVDPTTGVITTTTSTINREDTSQLTLTVKAEDNAVGKLSAFCTFTLHVQVSFSNPQNVTTTRLTKDTESAIVNHSLKACQWFSYLHLDELSLCWSCGV